MPTSQRCALTSNNNTNTAVITYVFRIRIMFTYCFTRTVKRHQLQQKCAVIFNQQTSSNSSNAAQHEFAAAYVPSEVENTVQVSGYFEPPLKPGKAFSLVLPPPNITGILHLGHALTVTVEDVLVRWNRMRGVKTLWVPGMDHAGIATQVVVEKRLWKERRQTRHDLGRELFEKEVWKWKEEKAPVIGQQLRRLGASLDWPREMFTMDAAQSRAVTEAFIKLYECGLIYRSDYLVNWSCVLQSAISDVEVEHLQVSGPTEVPVPGYERPVQFGLLHKFAYKLLDSDEEIVVATTRPETVLGDVAVAVNPKDDRYSSFIGRNLWHPFRKETIPIICDDFVDPAFGTGAVKVTPAHDHIDFEVGKRHGLNVLQIIDERGNLSDALGEFSGTPRFAARNIILAELDRLNLLRGRQDHQMIVPICSRSKDVIEFLVKPQWFVKCQEMAQRALEDVRQGRLTIDPPEFEKTWLSWLENIRDWCVSRQLWWGHRVPVYTCSVQGDGDRKCWVAADNPEAARSKAALQLSTARNNVIAEQDEDVLDTWFSSALFPFSTLGWPQQTKDLSEYYPLSMMETGHDILFFWVARMVMLGTQLTGQLPFSRVLLHGVLCDAHGRKMSKSLGNVITPEDVISGITLQDLEFASKASHAAGVLSDEELTRAVAGQRKMFPAGIPACGADALRFTLCSHNIKSHFINFDVDECNTNRLFCNKIWQATKFTKRWIEKVSEVQILRNISDEKLSKMDRWILSRLSKMVRNVNEGLERNEFHVATAALKNFLYYDFCDVYLESTKRGLRSAESEAAVGHCSTLLLSLDVGLRALAPFMPYLAQHLHQRLPFHPGLPRELDFPQHLRWADDELESEIQALVDAVVAIRRLKKLFNVTAKHKPQVRIVSKLPLYSELSGVIEDLAACDKVTVVAETPTCTAETVSDTVGSSATIYLPLPAELRKALEIDLAKLEKKRTKVLAELQKMQSMTAAESYRINAAAKVQQAHAKKIASLEEELARISYMRDFSKS